MFLSLLLKYAKYFSGIFSYLSSEILKVCPCKWNREKESLSEILVSCKIKKIETSSMAIIIIDKFCRNYFKSNI